MKYLKILGLGGLTAIVLMAFASTAPATILTSPAGTQMKKGEFVKGELVGEAVLTGSFVKVNCTQASGEGIITDAGSATETVKGEIFLASFSGCNYTVTVNRTGTTEVHTAGASANGNGTLTSTGGEVSIATSVGTCVFTTNNTHLGSITGGSPAVLAINSAPIPRTGGNFLCGSKGTFTAELEVTSPSTLLID